LIAQADHITATSNDRMGMDWQEHARQIAPGAVGGIVAMLSAGGGVRQMLTAFAGGAGMSYYGAEHAAGWLGVNPGFAGFLLGLFGMAIAARVFDLIAAVPASQIIRAALKRIFGIEL
jgi:hypothetical protein